MTPIRFALLIAVALPLAGCGNKGPLVLAPRPETPPQTPGEMASQAMATPSTVTAPADPTGSSQTVAPADSVLPPAPTTTQPAAPSSVAPPAPSTTAPPAPSTTAPPPADQTDGTPGTPR
jgi:predicted small lipoprotein YifL